MIITRADRSLAGNDMSMFYSSNGVDALISPYLPEIGYAAEVGANDGVSGSNAKHFEDKGWTVVCVEPNPRLAEIGRKNRKLWREVACGSVQAKGVPFTIVWNYPWGSFSGFHTHEVPSNLNAPDFKGQDVVTVNMDTLNHILEDCKFPRLDLLTIDVEGHELEVLKGIDLDRWRPKIIVAEAWDKKAQDSITEHLVPYSYVLDQVREYDCCYGRRIA